ncbi:DUF1616 domain-containing protein [Halomicrococcus sp. NG-SE-24]|uniref:DUF1616 domain-containing protein n=1 Tax=Halomicrococcus sp. NG-SE-24 TaxID=3436928 RepID=UPI003D964899
MATDVDPWLLVPSPLRRLPADLTAIIGYVCLTCFVVLVPGINETPIRAAIGLPFVLFPPGYAFIAALFPEASTTPEQQTTDTDAATDPSENDETVLPSIGTGITGLERVALSFGTSIAIVPLLGLILNFTPFGIRLIPVLLTISAFTLAMTAIAAWRRWELPEDERFSVPYQQWGAATRAELFSPDTRADAVLNVVLVLCLLLATSSVIYAVAVPKQGESFSEFYLLTKNETGDLVADDYPTNFTEGEPKSLYVGIQNHEHEQTQYSVVVLLQRVNKTNSSISVLQERELKRFHTTLDSNETWRRNHTISPSLTGQEMRLQYLLYRGNVPSNPSANSAYRELHLWVNVTAADGTPQTNSRSPDGRLTPPAHTAQPSPQFGHRSPQGLSPAPTVGQG